MSTFQYPKGPTAIPSRSSNYASQAIDGFTMEALNSVITSVPEWHTLLDNLNGQIDSRQTELAALGDYRPSTRSLKPKGSTESLLRPKGMDDPIMEDENALGTQNDPPNHPTLTKETVFPAPSTPGRTTGPRPTNGSPPQLFHHSSSSGPAPLQRRASQRINAPNGVAKPAFPTVLRKRKTESVATAESLAPKYRTRSMIVVYYDSAVQFAFEELVKLISASRNAMRKGKMAARMAEMKRIADIEAESSDDENGSALPQVSKGTRNANGHAMVAVGLAVGADEGESNMPKLEFVSTRKMGPTRDSAAVAAFRSTGQMMGGGRRPLHSGFRDPYAQSPPSFTTIFDELDSGLEWCQSMCEHAAHQFLRDGTCSVEIEGVKSRLTEVKEIAEREATKVAATAAAAAEKLRAAEAMANPGGRPEDRRGLKNIQMRKSVTPVKVVEAGHIEVDDEGYDEEIPTLQWRSSRKRFA